MRNAIFLPIVIDGEVSAKRTEGSWTSIRLMTPPSAYDADTSPALLGRK
jgi:hypothetical protein